MFKKGLLFLFCFSSCIFFSFIFFSSFVSFFFQLFFCFLKYVYFYFLGPVFLHDFLVFKILILRLFAFC